MSYNRDSVFKKKKNVASFVWNRHFYINTDTECGRYFQKFLKSKTYYKQVWKRFM